jgi:hypothetical protein
LRVFREEFQDEANGLALPMIFLLKVFLNEGRKRLFIFLFNLQNFEELILLKISLGFELDKEILHQQYLLLLKHSLNQSFFQF